MAEIGNLKVASRLTAVDQVLQTNDIRHRNLPFVILRCDRPLHLQQRPFSSDGPHEVPIGSYPPSDRLFAAQSGLPAMALIAAIPVAAVGRF
jgi:hypothetical protein